MQQFDENGNKVRLLLDGLDEIKEDQKLYRFNKWLAKIPKNTSITITTRPYAANKIRLPEGRNLDYFITLKAFTNVQIGEYVKEFIEYLFEECNKEVSSESIRIGLIVDIVLEKFKVLDCKKILGIPLECYLLCEYLKYL